MREVKGVKGSSIAHFVHGLFLLSAVFLLLTFLLMLIKRPSTHQPLSQQKAQVNDATLTKNYTAHYPVFSRPTIDTTIRNYIEQKVRGFEQKIARKKDIRHRLTTRFKVVHAGIRTASVIFYTTERIIGHPDVLTTERFTFDLQEDRLLKLQDIISSAPSARTTLAHLLHDYFKQQPRAALTSSELVNLLELQVAQLQDFTLEDTTLTLFLNLQQPADVSNRVGIRIEKMLLADVLLERYRTADASKAQINESVSYHITERPPAGNTINPAEKMIALTFDDGPNHLTPHLLDALHTYEADATFFVLGKMAASHAAILQRAVAEGNEIGNHSWGHPILSNLSGGEIGYQLDATQQAIQAATGGYTPTLMRPPYGATNDIVKQQLAARGLHETLWTFDTFDWHDRDVQLIYDRIMTGATDGQVVLLHDIHQASVEAALRAIRDLKARGFQLVTVSQLFQYR